MRRQQLFILAFCLLVGRWSAPLQAQEKGQQSTPITEIGGHNLEYWIAKIPSKDQSQSEHAIKMVVSFGPDRAYQAVPAILDRLRKHFTSGTVDTSVRVNGLIALGFILGNYKEADHKVIKDTVSLLRKFLADGQSIVRLRAAQALGGLGTDAKEAIPELIYWVKDPETFETRQAVALALGQVAVDKTNGASLNVLKALYGRLGDGSLQVRLAAIQSLTWLGAPLNPALRLDLIKALEPVAYKDTEMGVRIWAHLAIMNINGAIDKERVDAISQMVGNPELTTRIQAIQVLGTLGKEAKSAIPLLVKCLNDRELAVKTWAIWALGRMGPTATNTLPALERIKLDMTQEEIVRKMAEEAMGLINGKKVN